MGETPVIEARDANAMVAELGGKKVVVPPLKLEHDRQGVWRLVGEAGGVRVNVPIVHEPVAGKCIVRASGASSVGAFVRTDGNGWFEQVAFAMQIERVTPAPTPSPPPPAWRPREVGRATLRLHLVVGDKPEDMGRPGATGGFVRGRAVDVPMTQQEAPPNVSPCTPSQLSDGKPATGTVAKKSFVVASALLEEYPPSDEGPAGWALRLFDGPIRDAHPVSRLVNEVSPPGGVREVRFDFATVPTQGACIALEREWMVTSPWQAPEARIHITQMTPGEVGKPGSASARVDYDWGPKSHVTGKVDGIVVRSLATRADPLPIAPRVVDRCD